MYDNYDKDRNTSSTFVDYQQAFDTINHNIAVTFCKNYLLNRFQKVKLDECESNLMPVRMGVPQGSIIGPFMFIVYINNMIYSLRELDVSVVMYADDTVLYAASESIQLVVTSCQRSLDQVYNWCMLNRLSINCKKTKHMLVKSRADDLRDEEYVGTKIDGAYMDNVNSYNYLGDIIDNKLTFTDFVENK